MLESGDYENLLSDQLINRGDEVGRLSSGIEVLRVSIKDSLNEVNAYGQTLETEVKKRTLELLDSHQDLEDALILNESQNKKLLEVNRQLEEIFEQLEQTHRQIIETEKIASINAMMTKIATEFDEPLNEFSKAIQDLYEEKKNIDEKLMSNELRMFELDQFFSIYELKAGHILSQLDYMKHLLERFKALDPYTSNLETTFNMLEMINMVLDGISLRTDVHATVICDPNMNIKSDAAKISQILYQLISNANNHAFEDLRDGMIVVDIRMEEDLIISVKDNGIGIDDTIKDNIFNLVEDASTSGYGLNIVSNIVLKVFKGDIKCISEKGQGSEFIITIGI
jgi:signal transduction histidine kinase